MFKLENNRILSKDGKFLIEYKKPLEDWLDGSFFSYYCEQNSQIELHSGTLTGCIKSIKRYKGKNRFENYMG